MVPAILVKALSVLPSLPPEVEPWLAPSGFLAGLALVLGLQGQRINELRSEMKTSEARQQAAMADLKADNRAINGKLDRLIDSLGKVQQG